MKLLAYSILSIFLFTSCDSKKQQSTSRYSEFSSFESEQRLRFLKEFQWPKSYREQDTSLLNLILADEFVMISDDGSRTDKEFELNWIKKNTMSYDSFWYEIKRLEIFENGSAIVDGTGHILNEELNTTYESSNFFIWRDGNWQALGSHVSGIKSVDYHNRN